MNPQHTPLQSAPVLQTALAHRSIRKFTGAPIAPEQLAAILEAGRAAFKDVLTHGHIRRDAWPTS